eukprot:COSAG01_NODE_22471_length_854_cov_1.686093_1_plen_71_part_10
MVPSQVLVSVREELFDAMLPRETPAMQRLITRRYESFKESLAAQIGASGTALGPVARIYSLGLSRMLQIIT